MSGDDPDPRLDRLAELIRALPSDRLDAAEEWLDDERHRDEDPEGEDDHA